MDEVHVEEYVRERLRRGDSVESIREMVKVSGYDPTVVDKIISEPADKKGKGKGNGNGNGNGNGKGNGKGNGNGKGTGSVLPNVPTNLKTAPRKRPTWITIYAVFLVLSGLFSGGVGVFAFYLGDMFGSKVHSIAGFGFVMGVIFLAKGVLGIVGGIGLLKMSRWGYNTALIFLVLDILMNLNASSGQQLIDAVIAYYLYKNRGIFY